MTEFLEGPIEHITHWSDGKGGNITLNQNPTKIYFEGNLSLNIGKVYRLELIPGVEKHEGEYELVSARELVTNPVVPQPGLAKMITMPFDQLQEIMKSRMSLSESRVRALDNAAKVYAGMGIKEPTPDAAANDVVTIAKVLEKYLL